MYIAIILFLYIPRREFVHSKNLKGPLKGLIYIHALSVCRILHEIYMYLSLSLFQISKAVSDSCPISPSTVEIVDECPDTEERWRKTAARKNCSAYASHCGEPDRLKYHCVINSFANQTLEVCAYKRIIVSGRI